MENFFHVLKVIDRTHQELLQFFVIITIQKRKRMKSDVNLYQITSIMKSSVDSGFVETPFERVRNQSWAILLSLCSQCKTCVILRTLVWNSLMLKVPFQLSAVLTFDELTAVTNSQSLFTLQFFSILYNEEVHKRLCV